MSYFNTIVINLFDIAEEVRRLSEGAYCHVESFQRDQIRYEDGVLIRLMNEILTQLRVAPEIASNYDFMARPLQNLPGNLITEDKLVALYSEFFRIVEPELKRYRIRESGNY